LFCFVLQTKGQLRSLRCRAATAFHADLSCPQKSVQVQYFVPLAWKALLPCRLLKYVASSVSYLLFCGKFPNETSPPGILPQSKKYIRELKILSGILCRSNAAEQGLLWNSVP
jgi:hypothetical protein